MADAAAPEEPTKDRIRDAIAERSPRLDGIAPKAIDLAADVLAVLHQQLHGRAASLHGHRSAKARREQLRGEDALTIEDLAYLTLEAPRAIVLALDVLARRVGYRVVPVDPVAPSFGEVLARQAESGGELLAAGMRANADGQVSPDEAQELRELVAQHERTIAQMKVVIDQGERAAGEREGRVA